MTTNLLPIFCALDTTDAEAAVRLAERVRPYVGGFKVGYEFFLANGAAGYGRIAALGAPIFLDLKLHDIPNTVRGALKALAPLHPGFLTVHTSGGEAMLRAAVDEAATVGPARPRLLGVTVLTSLDDTDLEAVGQTPPAAEQVLRLGRLAIKAGCDGLICSAAEVGALRTALGPTPLLVVPGVRPAGGERGDQKRSLTPAEAIRAGASWLVVGRPITAAADPVDAARRIAEEVRT